MLPLKRNKQKATGRQVQELPIEDIMPNPYQPRKYFDPAALRALAQSIAALGVLQPICVRPFNKGYELISGERRLRASLMAGKTTIPALVVPLGEQESALLALAENLQRQELHYLEEAQGYENLLRDHGLTQEELAHKLGKKPSALSGKLRLLQLSPQAKKTVYDKGLSEQHARALLKIPDRETRQAVLATVVEKELNIKDTEALVEQVLEDLRQSPVRGQQREILAFCDLRLLTNTIRQSLSLMEKAGISATYREEETDAACRIVIEIPKQGQESA